VSSAPPAVALHHIDKRFGPVLAIDDASLAVQAGEIHALLGENGAGKTSLMNVLAGLYRPDSGTIELSGRAVQIQGPDHAKRLGIGMVHQEQRLVTRFSAPENVTLGHPTPRWLLPRRYFRTLAERLSARYGLPIDPSSPIWSLPLGRRQRVELVKLLHHGARIIILDEPTANLAPAEVEAFFGAVRQLVASGRTVLFITHKLDEVIRYTDRVTIMRAGRVIATFGTAETSRAELNQLMVGTAGERAVQTPPSSSSETSRRVLVVRGLRVTDSARHVSRLEAVDLEVSGGEVVAIAGVAGNGQTELAEAITGHVAGYRGTISIAGRDIRGLARGRWPSSAWRTCPRTAARSGSSEARAWPSIWPCGATTARRSAGPAGSTAPPCARQPAR